MNELYDVSSEYIDFGDFGKLYFTKVKDKRKLYSYLEFLLLQKEDLLKYLKDKNEILYENLNVTSLYDFLRSVEKTQIELYGLQAIYQGFKDLFLFCFNEDVFHKIPSNKDFEYLRELIIEVNCIPYEKPNPNPEIEWFNKLERELKQKSGESITFDSMYTSVLVITGQNPDDMTLYKFHKVFFRIAQIKNFDISALFKTVDTTGKIQIESWAKPEEDKKQKTISLNELMSKKKKL